MASFHLDGFQQCALCLCLRLFLSLFRAFLEFCFEMSNGSSLPLMQDDERVTMRSVAGDAFEEPPIAAAVAIVLCTVRIVRRVSAPRDAICSRF